MHRGVLVMTKNPAKRACLTQPLQPRLSRVHRTGSMPRHPCWHACPTPCFLFETATYGGVSEALMSPSRQTKRKWGQHLVLGRASAQ